MTNCEEPSFPKEDDEFYNFITARPDLGNQKHAEALIMDRFETLKTKYEEIGGKDCTHIVLYTWLPPCGKCAKEIMDTLKYYKEKKIYIIYSFIPEGYKNFTDTKRKLDSAGIELREVKYFKFLSKKNH